MIGEAKRPSRCSLRSEGRPLRPPTLIRVNRDAATTTHELSPVLLSDFERGPFRTRTFSGGFLRNSSLELLLGVDCEACLALAAHAQCCGEHDFEPLCNCDGQPSGYDGHLRHLPERRGHTLSTCDVERMRRDASRSHFFGGTHCSLDRKQVKSKQVSGYISNQFISYEQTSTLVNKIKKKLSELTRMGGEAMVGRGDAAVQAGTSLASPSLLWPSHEASSQACDFEGNESTYANFSSDVEQCFDRLCDRSADPSLAQEASDVPTANESKENLARNSSPINFSTLDGRSRCRGLRRQVSCDELAAPALSPDAAGREGGRQRAAAQCTCDGARSQLPSRCFEEHGKKTAAAAPAPDVTARAQGAGCGGCKPARGLPASAASTASHSSTATGNSRLGGWQRRWCWVAALVLVAGTACVAGPLALRAPPGTPLAERLRLAQQLLHDTPLIDGHNDLPWNIRKFLHNRIKDFRFEEDLRAVAPWATSSWSHTDLPRLKQGRLAAQFWAAYVPCESQHKDAVQLAFEQIDLIRRLTDKYQRELAFCASAADIVSAHASHRLCSLVGVEGGHAIAGSLGVLRTLYQVGVRYLTLTSSCDTPWAESAAPERSAPTPWGGLSPFGKVVIQEMNRLGMLVDLSHASQRTMRAALAASRAPVLFSHSSARALCNVTRNVPDAVLRLLAANRGLVMVNFYSAFLACGASAGVHDAIAHINHIRDVAGVDHVGLGAGYDGINHTPRGLEDVASYPLLFAELMEAGWSMNELKKLAGLNLLRVLRAAEGVARELAAARIAPYEDAAPRLAAALNCSSRDL